LSNLSETNTIGYEMHRVMLHQFFENLKRYPRIAQMGRKGMTQTRPPTDGV